MPEETIAKKAEKIRQVYMDFQVRLAGIKKKQREIINNFVKREEEEKIEEARKKLGLE